MAALSDKIYGKLLLWVNTVQMANGLDYVFLAVLVFTALGLKLAEHGRRLKRRDLTLAGGILTWIATGWSCTMLWLMYPKPPFYKMAFAAFIPLTIFSGVMIGLWQVCIDRRLRRTRGADE